MPGANESSTVEWQSAHWMPDRAQAAPPVEEAGDADDGVELQQRERRRGIVEVDLARSERLPQIARGSASTSTLRPSASAVRGRHARADAAVALRPAIASCSWSVSPQNASSPKVSKRNVRLPLR